MKKKYANFALEKVLNYFCYFFSLEVYFDIEKKRKGNNTSVIIKSLNNSEFMNESAINEAFDVFDNLFFFKEKKNFFVYKRNEYSIVFVYQGDSNNN